MAATEPHRVKDTRQRYRMRGKRTGACWWSKNNWNLVIVIWLSDLAPLTITVNIHSCSSECDTQLMEAIKVV